MAVSTPMSVFFIFTVLLVRITSAKYYPDIVYETGSSCSEKVIFATNKDPFYQWITRSYLIDGFQSEADYFTIQEAGTSYKKLSEWRVTNSSSNGTVKMFNSPEPHVIGGSFRTHPHNLIARMTVNWGLSIRICLGDIFDLEGQNMCRYTGQVIAVKEDGDNVTNIDFKMLLSQVYFNNTQQKVSYLTNWVSNARVPGAVEENGRIEDIKASFWYYSNPLLETSCGSNRQFIYYRPDMVAYLGDSYEECACVGNVCVQTLSEMFPVQSGEFNRSSYPCNNESVRSYWIPLLLGVDLYSFSSKFDAYYILPTIFNTSIFPADVEDTATINAMESLSSCFEAWLDDQQHDPGQLTNEFNLSQIACVSELICWNCSSGYKYVNAIVANHVGVVWSSLKEGLATGDNCQETSKEETVCSSYILTREEKQGIEDVIINFSQIKEVKAYAKSQWEEMEANRHDSYLDIVTAILALFSATVAVFSPTLVKIEQIVVRCYRCVSKQCIRMRRKTEAGPLHDVEQIEIELAQIHDNESNPQAPQTHKLHSKATLVRWFIRFVVLGGVGSQFAYTTWDTLNKLKSGPDVAWTQTIEYQPSTNMAFLVTITSTIEVAPKWTNIYILGAIFIAWFSLAIHRIYKHVRYWPASPKP